MTNPKFFPGEVVILQSVNKPHLNGEYTVLDVIHGGDLIKCRITGKDCKRAESGIPAYRLVELIDEGTNGIEALWKESTLRKKHVPGDMSFTELMSSLTIKEGA